MLDTQKIALLRAEALLKAAGVMFAIQLPDGAVLGSLKLAPPEKTRKHINDFVTDFGYMQTMTVMTPGQAESWQAEGPERATGLQKVVSAAANRLWGSDNFVTTVANGHKVEVLRVL